jgi:serine/tyrosine/threonine adenylyltransferase
LDAYDPATVFSSIGRAGRYAYGNQPAVALQLVRPSRL